jgi:hypothetical protein
MRCSRMVKITLEKQKKKKKDDGWHQSKENGITSRSSTKNKSVGRS